MLGPAEVTGGQAVPLWEDKGGIYSQPLPPWEGWAWAGNGDGYLTLEAKKKKGSLQTLHCFSHQGWRYGNCSPPHPPRGSRKTWSKKSVTWGKKQFAHNPSLEWSREHAATQAVWTGCSDSTHRLVSGTATQFKTTVMTTAGRTVA